MFGDFHPPSFGSSPHTRGARPSASCPPAARRIIPAYAGSTDSAMVSLQSNRDHPRIRGEHRAVLADRGRDDGSSPHTRGARSGRWVGEQIGGIIPAYAGSTHRSPPFHYAATDHPRIRGEHRTGRLANGARMGSSPHTRGARAFEFVAGQGSGIIPAYAGSTWNPDASGKERQDHPRIRGEHIFIDN